MKTILSADKNWGIGYQGNLLKRIPEDMKYFREATVGKVVIMGRKTFDSLPGKEPLKDRVNIVLTENIQYENEKVIVCRSLEALLHQIDKYNPEDVFVIGGAAIYAMLLDFCTEVLVTKFDYQFEADKFFINLDKKEEWKLVWTGDVRSYQGIQFRFTKYQKDV